MVKLQDLKFGLYIFCFLGVNCTTQLLPILLEQKPYISQVYVGSGSAKNKAIEIKNKSNTESITSGMYYLVYYQGNGAPANLTTPTSSIDIALTSSIAPNQAKVIKGFSAISPNYVNGLPTEVMPLLAGYDGMNDVLILSTSNGANAYNDRIDVLGDNSSSSVFYKEYILENFRSLVRMSCTPMGYPRNTYDEQDWVGFTESEVAVPNSLTNAQLGRHFEQELEFVSDLISFPNGYWKDSENVNPVLASKPDRSRRVKMIWNYSTNQYGNFEACSMTVNNGITVAINGTHYIKLQISVNVLPDGKLDVQNGGALVMVRDFYYGVGGIDLTPVSPTGEMVQENGTVNQVTPYDYLYLSSPLAAVAQSQTANQIFSFGTGVGQFDPNRFYLFHNENYCDIINSYNSWGTGYSIDSFDDNVNDFLSLADTGTTTEHLLPGRGYITWPPIAPAGTTNYNYTVTYKGVMNNGEVPVKLFKNNAIEGENSNMIGNPYPCAINLDKFFQVNQGVIIPAAYLWSRLALPTDPPNNIPGYWGLNYNHGNYTVYYQGIDSNPFDLTLNPFNLFAYSGGKYVASGQSFFINTPKDFSGFTNLIAQVPNYPIGANGVGSGGYTEGQTHADEEIINAGKIKFTNYMRTTEPNIYFSRNAATSQNLSTSNLDKLVLKLEDQSGFNVLAAVLFAQSGQAGFNQMEDIKVMHGRKMNLYSIVENKDLIINKQDAFSVDKVIPLGIFNVTVENNVPITLSLQEATGVFATQSVYLYDALLHTYHNLSSPYTLTMSQNSIEGRFSLVFTTNSGNFERKGVVAEAVKVGVKDNLLLITATKNISKVEVYDIYNPTTGSLLTALNMSAKSVQIPVKSEIKIVQVNITLEDGTIHQQKVLL